MSVAAVSRAVVLLVRAAMPPSSRFISASGVVTSSRKKPSVRSASGSSSSHRICASRHVTRLRPASEKIEFSPRSGSSPHSDATADSSRREALGELGSMPASTFMPAPSRPSSITACPMSSRASRIIGPISREGSSTTALPDQCSSRVMAVEVFRPPEPANMMECVGPSVHGSTSSGALPPPPQVRRLRGSKATLAVGS